MLSELGNADGQIIDRIIAQEGFEHILSVDYKTRRMGTRSASGGRRGSLQDITNAMQVDAAPREMLQGSHTPATTVAKEEKKARPLSMLGRAMSGSADRATADPPVEAPTADAKEAKAEKRVSYVCQDWLPKLMVGQTRLLPRFPVARLWIVLRLVHADGAKDQRRAQAPYAAFKGDTGRSVG